MNRLLVLALVVAGLCVAWLAWQAIKAGLRRGIQAQPEVARGGRPALLYFSGPDCAPCRFQQSPIVDSLRQMLGDSVSIQEYDAVAEPELAARYRVLTVPTTAVVAPDGEVVAINYGVTPAERLRRQLAEAASRN